jgi:LPS export ABC transporter permease LptF/LPS export ABC transporter permease LptG
MRILTRYILKEVFSHSLLGLLVFTLVIFIRHVGHLLELVVRHSLQARSILELFLLPIPGILVLTIPMAVLVGTLIGLSRMSADGEVIAARASGIGLGQFVRPVMMIALVGWGVAMWMSLFLAPQSLRKLHRMEQEITTSEVPYEIQPRVFLEQFPSLLLYLQDITGSRSEWRGVFIADTSERGSPKVTLAESGMLVNDRSSHRLTLHLEHGTTHEIDPDHPERYSISSFTDTDIPIPPSRNEGAVGEWRIPPALSLHELVAATRDTGQRQAALVELHYRFALPIASLVLALVGIPLGLSTRKGGKSVGVVLTILLVFLYYIIMAFGLGFAKQGRLTPRVGLWLANGCFGIMGTLMLLNLRRVRTRLQHLQEILEGFWRDWQHRLQRRSPHGLPASSLLRSPDPRPVGERFFQLLDLYIFRGWVIYFFLLLAALTGIYVIFDFYQILGDILRNHISAHVVFDYYRFLLPQAIYYPALPLSVLVATLVNFGLLAKTNQITAIKSSGVSIYRISVPILAAAAALSAAMYVLGDYYLPETNQRWDALRNQIKGKPPQTYYRPDRQWIFGQSNRIYNHRFFDPDRNVFADLWVFEFDPHTFRITRRIYASRALWEAPIHGWVLENGWVRNLDGERVTSYMPFSVAKFDELTEEPPYFKKEIRPSAQMSAWELRRYIDDLSQSGFDVVRLSVQFYRKFSFPLIAFVVALLGIPFSLSMGRKGALSGIAVSITIAIVYWSVSSLFEAMGNLSQLPPIVAAWSPDVLFGLVGTYLLLRVRT